MQRTLILRIKIILCRDYLRGQPLILVARTVGFRGFVHRRTVRRATRRKHESIEPRRSRDNDKCTAKRKEGTEREQRRDEQMRRDLGETEKPEEHASHDRESRDVYFVAIELQL